MDVRRENLEDVRARGVTGQQHQLILGLLAGGGEWSRNEIAERLQLRVSSVCARTNELLKVGQVEALAVRRCRVTGRRVAVLRAAP